VVLNCAGQHAQPAGVGVAAGVEQALGGEVVGLGASRDEDSSTVRRAWRPEACSDDALPP
jgi:hypothetical protein